MTGEAAALEVALYYDHDCPLAAGLRVDVVDCLAEVGLPDQVHDHVAEDVLSPTLLINGVDVLEPQPPGRGCRRERPSIDQIRSALAHRLRGLA